LERRPDQVNLQSGQDFQRNRLTERDTDIAVDGNLIQALVLQILFQAQSDRISQASRVVDCHQGPMAGRVK
jgi:hypothetical protein